MKLSPGKLMGMKRLSDEEKKSLIIVMNAAIKALEE